MTEKSNYRWFVIGVFFIFMLLHQADKLLIGPLTSDIMAEFNINHTQMGFLSTGALLVGAISYPLWGYLYDRFARVKLLALASFLWGSTTWLSAVARSYTSFFFTRATTGIDDSSYPGLYSLVSDYFGPQMRGKIFGLLQLSGPIGYLLGMVLGLFLVGSVGWRGVFYITGSLGIVVAAVILFTVREPERGSSEPELQGLELTHKFTFNWQTARALFEKRSLRMLFIQGFFGVFPWNVITYWIFKYLETERHYTEMQRFTTMVVAILVLAAGYPLGGWLGDFFFKRNPRGRLLVAAVGVLSGAVLLTITLNVPNENTTLFTLLLALTALFIPIAGPNVLSTVHDITVPEVRSTAVSIQYLIESSGAALAPGIAGLIADEFSLKAAFLGICLVTWVLCAIFFVVTSRYISHDVDTLRAEMRARAAAAG